MYKSTRSSQVISGADDTDCCLGSNSFFTATNVNRITPTGKSLPSVELDSSALHHCEPQSLSGGLNNQPIESARPQEEIPRPRRACADEVPLLPLEESEDNEFEPSGKALLAELR